MRLVRREDRIFASSLCQYANFAGGDLISKVQGIIKRNGLYLTVGLRYLVRINDDPETVRNVRYWEKEACRSGWST